MLPLGTGVTNRTKGAKMCDSNNLYHPDNVRIASTGGKSDISDEEAYRCASAFVDKWHNKSTEEFLAEMPETVPVDESDKPAQVAPKFPTWAQKVKAGMSDALADEWQRYAYTRKTNQPGVKLDMEDFRFYLTFWYGTDILA